MMAWNLESEHSMCCVTLSKLLHLSGLWSCSIGDWGLFLLLP